ncbi:unnamed protein product [Peronospora effusa]|nr:unnamed protein product [Peronospora effusa]
MATFLPPPSPTTSQLVTAIHGNDLSTFSSLLDTIPLLNVNYPSLEGHVPLIETCRYGRFEMATFLLVHVNADVNVMTPKTHDNSSGLTPIIAACMALDLKIVNLLLVSSQNPVNLLQTYGNMNAATVCLLFCVANGYTDEQNDTAVQILQQLVLYAKKHGQLEALLTAKADQVNTVLHVAAALSNWKALRLLRDEGTVDFNARNANGHAVFRVLEMNAFQARSFRFCELPQPEGDTGCERRKLRGRRHQRQRHQKKEKVEEKQEALQSEPSQADKQLLTRSRPDRAVEVFHVTQTVIELARKLGVGAIFSRKQDEGIRGLYIKALVLAELGIVSIVNEIARMSDSQEERTVYMDGLMHTVALLYPLSVKNAKKYQSLWYQALDKKNAEDLHLNAPDQSDEEEKTHGAENEKHPIKLSHDAFKLIVSRMLSNSSLSRRIKVWTLILMHLLAPFASGSPLAANESPAMEECGQIQFFERITKMIYISGTKLAFCIFDRTNIEDEESYDEEIEFYLLISLFELFLQFFAPYARSINDGEKATTMGIADSFQRAIKPVKQLWDLVNAALGSLDGVIATPQRFSLLLHILQVVEQLEAAFLSDENAALRKLFEIVSRFVKQEAIKKRAKTPAADQTRFMRTIATSFPIPTTFAAKVMPLKDSVDALIRSDPKVLGMDLYSLTSIPNLIRLEHKVDYLAILAEERNGSVPVSISRASEANYVDFIVLQILSASLNSLKGEMAITLVNEPGIGVGVTREFFQIVQNCFFRPESTGNSQVRSLSAQTVPNVVDIGSKRLHRDPQDKNPSKKRNDSLFRQEQNGEFAELFPLFDYVSKERQGALCIAPRTAYISKQVFDTKRSEKNLSLTQNDVLVDRSEIDALKRVYLCTGRLMGLAIRNHQALDADFPLVFWKFMLRDDSLTWESYCENSDVLKRSLQFVLDHDFDVEPLDMRFEYTIDVVVVDDKAHACSKGLKQMEQGTDGAAPPSSNFPITTSMEMELQEGMGSVEVTNANKAQYVMLRAQQFFFGNELVYYKKVRDGFNDTIIRSDLKLFRPEELRHLVRGERLIDFESLKKNVAYSRGASPTCGVVQRFWEVVESFDEETRAKLLTFWSGSPLPPIFGFDSKYRSMSADTASWYIDVDTQAQPNFCPTANTCDRRLILPDYPTSAALKEKLLVALEHGSVGYDRM